MLVLARMPVNRAVDRRQLVGGTPDLATIEFWVASAGAHNSASAVPAVKAARAIRRSLTMQSSKPRPFGRETLGRHNAINLFSYSLSWHLF